jgi:hypothetical protein
MPIYNTLLHDLDILLESNKMEETKKLSQINCASSIICFFCLLVYYSAIITLFFCFGEMSTCSYNFCIVAVCFGAKSREQADSSITYLASKRVECFPSSFNFYLKLVTGRQVQTRKMRAIDNNKQRTVVLDDCCIEGHDDE